MTHPDWLIEESGPLLLRVSHPDDAHRMNWVEGAVPWGTVTAPEGISCRVERAFTPEGRLRETYIFTNDTPWDIFCQEGDVTIRAPFNDSYHQADEELLYGRCHMHIWCGGTQSWVMALRMGGVAPHLGLMLTEGSLGSYSIERDTAIPNVSNDRGDLLLHPCAFRLLPGGVYRLTWELFWHEGKADFRRILAQQPGYIDIQAEQLLVFDHEDAALCVNGERQPIPTDRYGEQRIFLTENGRSTWADVFVSPDPDTLLARRARFIALHQQFHGEGSALDGAYLIYDNETEQVYYSHNNDHNGGRERVAMGVVVAQYLQQHEDPEVVASLDRYIAYVLRELFDDETGIVANDVHHNIDWHRLYNYPWMVIFFIELYQLKKDVCWLHRAVQAVRCYYRHDGVNFYCIGMPMTELTNLLENAGLHQDADDLRALFIRHAKQIAAYGLDIPGSEVAYEQSIVAPAVETLLMGYELSRDESLLNMGKTLLALLEGFSGIQPSHRLNEVAIRHWDGYWFGKRRTLGDTFPHYWSSLSGNAYARYARITGHAKYADMAERNLRASLSMFTADGRATCAHVYPRTINGKPGQYDDPWANDQDWALYFYIKWHMTGMQK